MIRGLKKTFKNYQKTFAGLKSLLIFAVPIRENGSAGEE
jgi:hypothetical protein